MSLRVAGLLVSLAVLSVHAAFEPVLIGIMPPSGETMNVPSVAVFDRATSNPIAKYKPLPVPSELAPALGSVQSNVFVYEDNSQLYYLLGLIGGQNPNLVEPVLWTVQFTATGPQPVGDGSLLPIQGLPGMAVNQTNGGWVNPSCLGYDDSTGQVVLWLVYNVFLGQYSAVTYVASIDAVSGAVINNAEYALALDDANPCVFDARSRTITGMTSNFLNYQNGYVQWVVEDAHNPDWPIYSGNFANNMECVAPVIDVYTNYEPRIVAMCGGPTSETAANMRLSVFNNITELSAGPTPLSEWNELQPYYGFAAVDPHFHIWYAQTNDPTTLAPYYIMSQVVEGAPIIQNLTSGYFKKLMQFDVATFNWPEPEPQSAAALN